MFRQCFASFQQNGQPLTPDSVIGEFFVPFIGGFKVTGDVGIDVLTQHFLIKVIKAKTGFFGNLNKTILENGIFNPGNHVGPPGNIHRVEFQCQHIVHGGGGIDGCHAGHGTFCHMDSHGNAVLVGDITDLNTIKANIKSAGRFIFTSDVTTNATFSRSNGFTYTFAVKGALTGDGDSDLLDLIRTKRAYAGVVELSAAQKTAASFGDTDKEEADVLKDITKYLLVK